MGVQVISALAMWPSWDSSEDSISAYVIVGIWLLANLPGIILAIPLFILASPGMVQADVFDGFPGYIVLIGGPTGLSVVLGLFFIRLCRRRMNTNIMNGESGPRG